MDYEFESEKLLRGLESELNAIEVEFKSQEVQYRAIEEEEKELRRKLDTLARRKREFWDAGKNTRQKIRNYRNKFIPEAESHLEIEKINKEQELNQAELSKHFDDVTADAPWRNRIYKHQLDGAHFMASAKRAVCADAMGLGKTLQGGVAVPDMLESKKTLIVCPGEVASAFEKEIYKWSNRQVENIARLPKLEQKIVLEKGVPLLDEVSVIINYESWAKNKKVLDQLIKVGFDTVILDEAHNIKNARTTQYAGIDRIVLAENKCTECDYIYPDQEVKLCLEHGFSQPAARSVENFFCMTGTPILNRPIELYPLLHLINPELFSLRFFNQFIDGDSWRFGAQARLAKEISGFYIGRDLKAAGIELPPQEKILHEIELDEEEYSLQAEIIEMIRVDAQLKIDEGDAEAIPSILALITRQRQASVWPGGIKIKRPMLDFEGNPVWDIENDCEVMEEIDIGKNYQQSCKLDAAVELYHELVDSGHRVVFFSQFKTALKEMGRRLGEEVAEFTGDTPQKQRELIKQNFDASIGEEPKWKGILCHYRPGGTGLNLTAATAMIILDEEWNKGKADQAYDRIHRIGQENKTQVHILRHTGPKYSIDKWMAALIERKAEVVAGFKTSVDELKGAFDR